MVLSHIIKSTFCILFFIIFCHSQEFEGFNDNILYKINWRRKSALDEFVKEQDENTLNVKTAYSESYKCFLPKQNEVDENFKGSYSGPIPLEQLSPLFTKNICSYKVIVEFGHFWTYEVCHNRYVRKYNHAMSQNFQEFNLGKWTRIDAYKLEEELRLFAFFNYPQAMQTKKVDGTELRYLKMNMRGGSICDLSGHLLQTNVLYVCYPQIKHAIFSVKIVSICEYEVIVLTSYLCSHPWYKPPKSGENIDCFPIDDSPPKFYNLKALQFDSLKTIEQTRELTIEKTKIQPTTGFEKLSIEEDLLHLKSPSNELEKYFSGAICLFGGSGWWKYEICYNKYIHQVHEEKEKPDEIVSLGVFDIKMHIIWLNFNKKKRPKVSVFEKRKVISHFYSKGSVCQETGEERETEVQYKCVKGRHKDSITSYLLEPKTCKYILTIESTSMCDLINRPIDAYGLFKIKSYSNINSKDSSSAKTPAEDKIDQQLEENIKEKNPVPVDQKTKVNNDKKEIGKVEL